VNVFQITAIDLKRIEKYNKYEQFAVYTAFIDFIISSYGKKIFVQSLKDLDYYNSFIESLSKISGDTVFSISDNFNAYLHDRKSDLTHGFDKKNLFFSEIDKFTDVSYSIAENHQVAVLKRNEKLYKCILKNGVSESSMILANSEAESIFSDLVFISNDQIAFLEVLESGSIVHIYDIKTNKFMNKFFFPLLFISDINPLGDKKLIFSATSGLKSNLYTVILASGEIDILTESGSNYCPVFLNDKVYFISRGSRSSIVELNTKSLEKKILFSTDQKIYNLNHAKTVSSKLIFNLGMDGIDNIFLYDLKYGDLHQITSENNSHLYPDLSGTNIYFFSFYRGEYRLFFKPHTQVIQ